MEHSETQNQNKTAHKVTREYAFLAFTGLLEAQIDNESHCITRGDDFELWWKSVMSRTLPGNRIPFRDSFRKSIQSSFSNFSGVFVPKFHSGFLMDYSSGFLQGFLHEFILGLLQKFLPEFCPGESRGFLQNLPGISLWISARVSVKTSEQVSSGFYSETPLKNSSSDQNFLQRFVQDVANSFWNFSRGFLPTLCRRFLLKSFRDSSYAFFGISPVVFPGLLPGFLGDCAVFWCFFPGFLHELLLRSSTRFLSDTFSGDWNLSGLLSSGIAYLKIWLELLPWDSTRSVPVNSPRVSHGTSPRGYLGISPRIFTELPSGFIPGVFRVIFLRDFYRMHHKFPVVIAAKINPGIS